MKDLSVFLTPIIGERLLLNMEVHFVGPGYYETTDIHSINKIIFSVTVSFKCTFEHYIKEIQDFFFLEKISSTNLTMYTQK